MMEKEVGEVLVVECSQLPTAGTEKSASNGEAGETATKLSADVLGAGFWGKLLAA